jgi:hypothetical protein
MRTSKQAAPGATMPRTKDDLQERLSRYRQIKISVTGRKSGRTIRLPSGLFWKARNSTSCPCEARTHSGPRTCPRIRSFAFLPVVWKENLRPFP